MALLYTEWADWVDRAGTEARLKQFAPGDTEVAHPKVEAAEMSAIDEMHSYLRKRGYVLPLDELPPAAKGHLLSLGLQWLTIKSDVVNPAVDKAAESARTYFNNIALGRATLGPDLVEATPGGSRALDDLLFSKKERTWDFDDPTSEGSVRIPKL